MKENKLYERYNRQIILKGFGVEAQLKLLQAKVLVVGAGGLGCPALQYLVGAGVGTIGIADDDLVSLSNLHRQVLYSTDDIGHSKAQVAATKLKLVNSDVTLIVHNEKLQNNNALHIIAQYDLVIDGTDNFSSRYLINDACVLLEKPLVYGAVSMYEGQVAIFNVANGDKRAVHYRDLFPVPPKNGEIRNCSEAGVLGMLPGIIGTMQATEVVKLLTGIGSPLISKLLTYDILTHETYVVEVAASPIEHDSLPTTTDEFLAMDYIVACAFEPNPGLEVNAVQFHQLRKKKSAVVIDVREFGETPLIKNLVHKQIPMSVFTERMNSIESQTILLVCQHGIRSLYAAELLHDEFGEVKEVYSLKGGLVKWGVDLDVQ
ncbi:MAG: HesA/MoeB/ThiF family protein [Chitinophagaceae bacterium]